MSMKRERRFAVKEGKMFYYHISRDGVPTDFRPVVGIGIDIFEPKLKCHVLASYSETRRGCPNIVYGEVTIIRTHHGYPYDHHEVKCDFRGSDYVDYLDDSDIHKVKKAPCKRYREEIEAKRHELLLKLTLAKEASEKAVKERSLAELAKIEAKEKRDKAFREVAKEAGVLISKLYPPRKDELGISRKAFHRAMFRVVKGERLPSDYEGLMKDMASMMPVLLDSSL